MDWQIQGLTGVEIYNTHADFKKQKRMIDSMKNPLWLIKTTELIDKYPQEAFSALQSYPDDYLKRWDQLCLIAPHTGVAANDAHQNIGVRVELGQDDKVIVSDALGEELLKLDRLLVAPLLKIPSRGQARGLAFETPIGPLPKQPAARWYPRAGQRVVPRRRLGGARGRSHMGGFRLAGRLQGV